MNEQVRRYRLLLELGQIITSEMNLDALFQVIMEQVTQFMDAERCSVFLYNAPSNQLWSLVSTDLRKNEIRLPIDHGVAGWVFQHIRPLIINDAYSDPRFFREVDKKTGFHTRNILCLPLINRRQECIGTVQTLNKRGGDFTNDDLELLTSASHYIAIALENAQLYEKLKAMDRAKERVINHLSHELKTPLAILGGVISSVRKKFDPIEVPGLGKILQRGQRSVQRLLDLQSKIDDVLNQRQVEEKQRIVDIVESAAGLVAELEIEDKERVSELLALIVDRIEGLFSVDAVEPQEIQLASFLDEVCERAEAAMTHRELPLVRDFSWPITLVMDKSVLEKTVGGLLKNAIENTPDEGQIKVRAWETEGQVRIGVHDYGVGIMPQNQSLIFSGFFHTQDTNAYASKTPYAFNAGGSGADLLRIKAFSERLGFDVRFTSERCRYLTTDRVQCPGRISNCRFISSPGDCAHSGHSIFTLTFNRTGNKG